MSDKKKSFTPFMSPLGTFVYPKLNKPDTKFKKEGEYALKLRLSAEDSEKFIAQIEEKLAEFWPIARAEAEEKIAKAKTGAEKAKAKKALEDMKEADKSYKPVYDDEGEETGEYEFNIKMPAQFESKKEPGKIIKIKPDIFNAKGTLLKNPPDIWGGSTGYIAGEFRPFSTNVGVGISLRLKGVQIMTMSSGGEGRSASAYGFGSHEDGYDGEGEEAPVDSEAEGGEGEGGPDTDPDDF